MLALSVSVRRNTSSNGTGGKEGRKSDKEKKWGKLLSTAIVIDDKATSCTRVKKDLPGLYSSFSIWGGVRYQRRRGLFLLTLSFLDICFYFS